uniref:Uncharacterized protein n=1 Tax=Arundo donax TaxID=35708 RepID=A0A0A8Z355_ARUDO
MSVVQGRKAEKLRSEAKAGAPYGRIHGCVPPEAKVKKVKALCPTRVLYCSNYHHPPPCCFGGFSGPFAVAACGGLVLKNLCEFPALLCFQN